MGDHDWVFGDLRFSQQGSQNLEIPVYCQNCGEEQYGYVSIQEALPSNLRWSDDCRSCYNCGMGEMDVFIYECSDCGDLFCEECLNDDGDDYYCRWCFDD